MGAAFVSILVGISLGKFPPDHGSKTVPLFFFSLFAVFWLGFVVLWLIRLLLAVVYGVRAGRGEWAEYPLLGRFARKILSIGPGGAVGTP